MKELFGERLLVEPIKEESAFKIADSAKDTPQIAEVKMVGTLIELDLKVGDKVVYAKYGTMEITVEGKKLNILNQEDVIGKM